MNRLFKSPNVLVLRQSASDGLILIHQINKRRHYLDKQQAALWVTWENGQSDANLPSYTAQALLYEGFLSTTTSADKSPIDVTAFDQIVPLIEENHIRWYAESPDLVILFNTKLMKQHNPLLTLAPYGSLCWHGITRGWSIGRIRDKAIRVFGYDEVLTFLKRLINLGFIQTIPQLNQINLPTEEITKEFQAPEIQFQMRQAAIPWYCLWEICSTCDLRCKICYLPNFTEHGPDLKQTQEITQQIIDSGTLYVCLLGGETLLRNDLEQIINQLHRSGIYTKVISNGQKLILTRALALAKAGLNQIEISFDGLSQQTHEASRGPGTYAKAIRAVYNAQQAGIPRQGMVWTIHTGNFAELVRLPEFMHNLGLQECYLSPFKKTGLLGALAAFNPIDITARQQIIAQINYWKESFPELTIVLMPECSCGRTSVVIGYNGDIRLCSFSYSSVGNVYQTPLLATWHALEEGLAESGPLGYCAPKSTLQPASSTRLPIIRL
ncbi:MAG: radical SAM protein [Acidobacteriota bacterium]